MARKTKALEYQKIGESAQELIVNAYGEIYNLRRQMWVSFVKGVFSGLGAVIGVTVMAGVLAWLLYSFGDVPFVGDFFKSLSETIKSYRSP